MNIELNPYINSRGGWTLIELIIIIVIIGILAALAIPRMSATRDDAKLSTTVQNMSVCIKDINTHYTATKLDYNDTFHPKSCDVNNTKCYNVVYGPDGELNVTTNPTADFYCADIENVGGHLAQDYSFGGSQIVR